MTDDGRSLAEGRRPGAAAELLRRSRLNDLAHRVLADQASEAEEEDLAVELEPRATNALRKTGTRMLGPRSGSGESPHPYRSDGWSIARQTIHECRLGGLWRAAAEPPFAYLLGAVHHKAVQEARRAQGTELRAGRRLPKQDPATEPLDGLALKRPPAPAEGPRSSPDNSVIERISIEHMIGRMRMVLSPGERQAMHVALEADQRDLDEQDVARERGLEPNTYRQSKARAARKLLRSYYGLTTDEYWAYVAARKVTTTPQADQPSAGASHLATSLSRPVPPAEYLRLLRAAQNKIYSPDSED